MITGPPHLLFPPSMTTKQRTAMSKRQADGGSPEFMGGRGNSELTLCTSSLVRH